MTQSPHIIIVDDEAPAREMVGDYLKMHGFGVTLCDGGKSLRSVIESQVPDLVVLDLNMPEEDGLSIIRDLKSRINVPVIMLTATASPIDRVVGLELGADDYVAKPCELRELMARIRSVLRRSTPAKAAAAAEEAVAKAAKEQLVRFGTKWLDLEAQALRDDEGNEHPLTASEFGLLKVAICSRPPATRLNVVPAKAGTHNHVCVLLGLAVVPALSNTDIRGYGSRLALRLAGTTRFCAKFGISIPSNFSIIEITHISPSNVS